MLLVQRLHRSSGCCPVPPSIPMLSLASTECCNYHFPPSTPSPNSGATHGYQKYSHSPLATPFVPKTAPTTPNQVSLLISRFPNDNGACNGGLDMSGFSPGMAGSHPGPPPDAYGDYTLSPPNHFQPGFGGSEDVSPHVHNGRSFSQHMQNSLYLSPSTQGKHNVTPPTQTRRRNYSDKRRFDCRICHQRPLKNILEEHIQACRDWVAGGRLGPAPDHDLVLRE